MHERLSKTPKTWSLDLSLLFIPFEGYKRVDVRVSDGRKQRCYELPRFLFEELPHWQLLVSEKKPKLFSVKSNLSKKGNF